MIFGDSLFLQIQTNVFEKAFNVMIDCVMVGGGFKKAKTYLEFPTITKEPVDRICGNPLFDCRGPNIQLENDKDLQALLHALYREVSGCTESLVRDRHVFVDTITASKQTVDALRTLCLKTHATLILMDFTVLFNPSFDVCDVMLFLRSSKVNLIK